MLRRKGQAFDVAVLCTVFVWALCAATSSAAQQAVSVSYDFETPRVELVGDYARVSVAGCSGLRRVGEPVVPFRTARVLLPPGTQVRRVRAEPLAAARTLPSRGMVEFARTPVPRGPGRDRALARAAGDAPDPAVYGSDRPYPAARAELVSVQRMCGYAIAIVRVFPVLYVPSEQELIFCSRIRVTLQLAERPFDPQALAMLRTQGAPAARVAAFVDNPDGMAAYAGHAAAPEPRVGYDYLLITTAALMPSFQPLVDQKVADGLSVTTETVENIVAGYPGVDDAEKVRNFIIDAYTSWGVQYVLLGGDIGTVPHRGAYGYCIYEDTSLPCDLYFSCLDGSWNGDADAYWGEPNDGPGGGDVDLLGEVWVGRAPVDDASEVSTFVSKIVAYEQNYHVFPFRAEFLAEDLGGGDQGGDALDMLLPHFGSWDVHWRDDRVATWGTADCLKALNYPAHVVAHDGHANETSVMRLGISDLDSLTNNSLFLVNSVGCYSGAFDYEDCIAEEFSKRNPHGAFAVIMNSRYGWYALGAEWLFSGEFQERFFYELLAQGHLNVGVANQLSKHDMVGSVETFGDMAYRWVYFELTLFGDPHTPLNLGYEPGLHHFQWAPISSPQAQDEPFGVIVTAKDAANVTQTSFTGTVDFTGWAPGVETLFSADFESGLDGFTVDNGFGVGGGLWHRTDGRGSDSGHSSPHSLYYGQNEGSGGGGDYDAGDTEGVVTSPVIDLTGAVAPVTLSFNYLLETECWPPDYDRATVEVSQDGGPFQVVASNGLGGAALTDPSWMWLSASADLSGCVGSEIRVRFHFATGDDEANEFEGWYVDDVTVTGAGSVPITPTVSGTFTDGVWTGDITVLETADDMFLLADDGEGHTGESNAFDVVSLAPPKPYSPDPPHMATDVLRDTLLSWNEAGGCWTEDFDDGLAQDWVEVPAGRWNVSAGTYVADGMSYTGIMQSGYHEQTWTDCSAEMTTWRTGLGSYFWNVACLAVRATPDFNFDVLTGSAYIVGIDADGWYWVAKLVNGTFTFLQDWIDSPYLNLDPTANTVRLQVSGTEIAVFFNGYLEWVGSDSSISSAGGIALCGYTDGASGNDTIHYFDDVSVCPPEELSVGAMSVAHRPAAPHGSGTPRRSPRRARRADGGVPVPSVGGGVGNCATTYDVYFDTVSPPTTLLAADLTEPTCDPTPGAGELLESNTKYYWKVVAKNCYGETEGDEWYFTTGTFWGALEHGVVWAGSSWTTVNLTASFSDPVVVAGPATSVGWHQGVVRLRNVTPTSFQVRFQEWDYLDGWHPPERIRWFAVERGTYDLGGGNKLIAETFPSDRTNVYSPQWVSFPESFGSVPVVLAQVQTANGSDAVTDRICAVYLSGMTFSMQEQESKSGHCIETIGYIAVSEGVTDILGVPCEVKRTAAVATHRPLMLLGAEGQALVRVEEERSADWEVNHWAAERVGFISLAGQPPLVADLQTCNGSDPCALRCMLLSQEFQGEHGVATFNHLWLTVPLLNTYQEPVVLAGPATYDGLDPGVIRVRNVTPTSFQIRFQEWDYLDGWHPHEDAHVMVVERGYWDLSGGRKWLLDEVPLSNANVYAPSWTALPVALTDPIVLATQQTANGWSAVTERLSNIATTGFNVALQEQEAADAVHAQEILGYVVDGYGTGGLAAGPQAALAAARSARRTDKAVSGPSPRAETWWVYFVEERSKDWETWHCDEDWAYIDFSYDTPPGYPFFVLDMQSCYGCDPCSVRTELEIVSPAQVAVARPGWLGLPACGLCWLSVRAAQEGGAELSDVQVGVAAPGSEPIVIEALPARVVCEPGDLVSLSAPASIGDGAAVLFFSHWELDGEPSPLGQLDVDVEVTRSREAVAVYVDAVSPTD